MRTREDGFTNGHHVHPDRRHAGCCRKCAQTMSAENRLCTLRLMARLPRQSRSW